LAYYLSIFLDKANPNSSISILQPLSPHARCPLAAAGDPALPLLTDSGFDSKKDEREITRGLMRLSSQALSKYVDLEP